MDEQALEDWKRKYANRPTEELRYRISRGLDPELSLALMEWVFERESADEKVRAAEHRRVTEESLKAAKLAAETSRDAAVASRRSAYWTMVAAVAGAVAAFCAAIGTALPLMKAVGWLPKL